MVLPDLENHNMGPPLRRGGIKGMGHKLNTCFKASERSSRRRQHMYVQIVRTPMRSKMKCRSTTLRQNVPVLHSMYISHMTLSAKYIIIKSFLWIIYVINASLLLIQFWCFFVEPISCFLPEKWEKQTPQLREMATSIGGKFWYNRH